MPTASSPLRQLVSPLSLAAYAAWGAVWMAAGPVMARSPAHGWGLRSALLLFLIGIVGDGLAAERLGKRGFLLLGIALAALALGVCAFTPHGASPILLVLLAAMLAGHLEWRELAWALLVLNLGLAAVMYGLWPGSRAGLAVYLCAYSSFQLFAALVMRYAAQAEAMTQQLREVNADLLATRSLLAEGARDSERLRLSRELHDVAGHSLTALKLNLAALQRDPQQPDPERIALCAGLADELLQSLRGVVRQMRQDEGIELAPALARLAAPLPRPQVELAVEDGLRVAGLDRAEAVLRTVQEGLTNAARHSGAQHAWLRVADDGGRLTLELRDDGRMPASLQEGNGLTGMRERLQAVGGGLAIDRGPEGGLRLRAWLPEVAA